MPESVSDTQGRPSTRGALEGAGIDELAVRAPIAASRSSVGDVRRSLVGRRHGSVSHVVVLEGETFVGLVRDVDLMAASADSVIDSLLMADPPVVTPSTTRDSAVWAALSRGESEVAVVDPRGALLGLVPASTLLAVLFREHSDDLARLSGYLHQGASARAATEESIGRRFLHRLPWLMLGLAGAAAAARVVGGFQQALERDVALAFFIPGMVYLADAVGTQTETVVIRGLSLGIPVRRILAREVATGLALGVTLGTMFYPVAVRMLESAELALAVALALGTACAVASFVALAVPWVIQLSGRDPAFGSGPLATVIQDLLSIGIYFAIVTWIVVR